MLLCYQELYKLEKNIGCLKELSRLKLFKKLIKFLILKIIINIKLMLEMLSFKIFLVYYRKLSVFKNTGDMIQLYSYIKY